MNTPAPTLEGTVGAACSADEECAKRKAGTNYYFQVTAYAHDKYDSGKPFVYTQHEAAARMFTGVVTP